MQPVDPEHMRISDSDRERVAEVLRQAAGDGRIDFSELDERLEAAYAAKTYADLVPITLDLPAHTDSTPAVRPKHAPARRSPAGLSPTWANSFALMGDTARRGVWDIGPKHNATAVMGSVVLDLREARFPDEEVVIIANAVMGGVEVIVDPRTLVHVEGIGIMGDFSQSHSKVAVEIDNDSPVVRVKGVALMGSVYVKHKSPPDQSLGRLTSRPD